MKLDTYTFKDTESELTHIIFASSKEKAQEIIDVANELSPVQFVLVENYVRIMDTPFSSYEEAEKEQMDVELDYLIYRKARVN